MINPVQTHIPIADGTDRYVIIEPALHKDAEGKLHPTGLFKIYKDALGDETHLFAEPAENQAQSDDLPDDRNPDYLGKINLSATEWKYEGSLLSYYEQVALVEFISNYRSPEEQQKQQALQDEFPESANPPEDLPLNPGSLS
ncbi:hypothetical protein SAMN05192574_104760 [Mucilaginibacter gossypiicola]|uniref:Uncharacterized protein n=1 Tax=Mucilaginibacter gossypiicola TaxID=551995 RepID=A0A1H8KSX5_9SPHI|nr:hypothetical protein [Mucilaginibacter gossypiicola]SEN95989.1 hypothetical protein SAMN05192574_104760 [Mucilaginibacter gossypiicola]